MADNDNLKKLEELEQATVAGGRLIASGGTDIGAWLKLLKNSKVIIVTSCTCGVLAFALIFGGLLFAINLFKGVDNPDKVASTGGLAAACGQKSVAQEPPRSDCDGPSGIMSKSKSPNGYYRATTFGCSGSYTDDADACDGGGCGGASLDSIERTDGVKDLKGLKGGDYQRAIGYFSANRVQFGCDARLKATNPETGQAVVVVPVDAGPGCTVQEHRYTFDMSYDAKKAIGNPSVVKVEEVDKSTPIGPVASCTAKGGINNVLTDAEKYINNFLKSS